MYRPSDKFDQAL
jgi:hypothetical protein